MTDTRDVSATEVLQELANFIDGTAAALVRVRDWQLQIDLSWTTVELKPATVEKIVGGLQNAAETIRHMVAEQGSARQ